MRGCGIEFRQTASVQIGKICAVGSAHRRSVVPQFARLQNQLHAANAIPGLGSGGLCCSDG
jgi:hypothetical protein